MKNNLFYHIAHQIPQRKALDSGSASSKPGASKGDSTFDDRLQRKIQGSDGATSFSTDPSGSRTGMSTSNSPAKVPDNDASEGGGDASGAKSTKEQWGEKVEVAEDATTSAADLVSSMPPSFYDVNDSDDEMMHAKMKPFTYKSQGSDGASQAEEVTADATPKPAQQQHMSGESPNDSENAPIARLPTNSIVPTGHQRARAPQQGHSNRASILPAVL